jgi:uncharacterized protein YbaR (Trm112 family)
MNYNIEINERYFIKVKANNDKEAIDRVRSMYVRPDENNYLIKDEIRYLLKNEIIKYKNRHLTNKEKEAMHKTKGL